MEYTTSDGTLTDTAELTVTVIKRNLAPTATDDVGATTERTTLTVADGDTGTGGGAQNADLLLNDRDPEADTLSITKVTGYSRDTDGNYQPRAQQDVVAGTPTSTLGSNGGTFTLYADGSYSFDPGADFAGLAAGATRTTSVQYTTL